MSEYAHELNATEEGRDLVAGNFRVPRSEDEMARFHAFVIGTVNNHSFSVVATPPSQVLTPMFTTPDACHNGSYQGSMCTCVREGGGSEAMTSSEEH